MIFLFVVTLLHMVFSARQIVPFPQIAILIATMQYGIATWMSYYYQTPDPEAVISDYSVYFAYAGPAVWAFALGFFLPIWSMRFGKGVIRFDRIEQRRLGQEMDILYWGGLAVSLAARGGGGGGLSFLLLLLANLRFVGAMGSMLLGIKGWKWRVGLLLGLEVASAMFTASFHSMILWALALFVFYIFLRRPKPVLVAGLLLGAALSIFALQHAKWKLRAATWFGMSQTVEVFGMDMPISKWSAPFVGGLSMIEGAFRTIIWNWDEEFLSETVMRYNQGWIINRVMQHVPTHEPYARGETIVAAMIASAVPRVLMPAKYTAGGRQNMERFAGLTMTGGTSMNLGFGGELYANFGLGGGVVCCGLYGLLMGLLYRFAASRAAGAPLWWIWVPYIGHWSIKAEEGLGEVLNYIFKSTIICIVLVLVLPAMRANLASWRFRRHHDPLDLEFETPPYDTMRQNYR